MSCFVHFIFFLLALSCTKYFTSLNNGKRQCKIKLYSEESQDKYLIRFCLLLYLRAFIISYYSNRLYYLTSAYQSLSDFVNFLEFAADNQWDLVMGCCSPTFPTALEKNCRPFRFTELHISPNRLCCQPKAVQRLYYLSLLSHTPECIFHNLVIIWMAIGQDVRFLVGWSDL